MAIATTARAGALLLAGLIAAGCVPVRSTLGPAEFSSVERIVPANPYPYRTADGNGFATAAERDAYLQRQADVEQELYEIELARQYRLSGSLSAQQRARRAVRLDRVSAEERRAVWRRQEARRAERAAERQLERDRRRRIGRDVDALELQRQRAVDRDADLAVDRAQREARRAERQAARAAQERARIEAEARAARRAERRARRAAADLEQKEGNERDARIRWLTKRVHQGIATESELTEFRRMTADDAK